MQAPSPPSGQNQDDESLVLKLVSREPEALHELYARYASLVFHIASKSLDISTAEEVVQDVFLTLWKKADSFDRKKGPFRPWLLQIAHYRILNELRHQSRQPQPSGEALDPILEKLPDERYEPVETSWNQYRRHAVQTAVDNLPKAQRRALSLAFFEDLSHDQVAQALNLPLGTVKTRIRSAMQKLRRVLAPIGIVSILVAALVGIFVHSRSLANSVTRNEKALLFATASNTTQLHIAPTQNAPAGTHGWYKSRANSPMALIALHEFPPAPTGKAYQVWVLRHGAWVSVGIPALDEFGNALLVLEGPEYLTTPDGIEVSLEPMNGSGRPTGPLMISWPSVAVP